MSNVKENENKSVDYSKMSAYEKLIQARYEFLNCGVTKSGVHLQLGFQFFTLDDIVPYATALFLKLGLLLVTNFDTEYAYADVVNVHNPSESVSFKVPFKTMNAIISSKGVAVTNDVQLIGSSITYYRRYLWLLVLDIVEFEVIDTNTGNVAKKDEPEVPKTINVTKEETPKVVDNAPTIPVSTEKKTAAKKKPATTDERKQVVKEITTSEKPADSIQIDALKANLSEILAFDAEMEEEIEKIVAATEEFKNISYAKAEQLIDYTTKLLEEYKGGVE